MHSKDLNPLTIGLYCRNKKLRFAAFSNTELKQYVNVIISHEKLQKCIFLIREDINKERKFYMRKIVV